MKKIFLVVQDRYRKEAMTALRDTGVMHIENTYAASADLSQAFIAKSWVNEAKGLLEPYKKSKKKKDIKSVLPENKEKIPNLSDKILAMDNDRKLLDVNKQVLQKERDRICAWGDFDLEQLKSLSVSLGMPIYLYMASSESVDSIPAEINYVKLSDNGSRSLLVVFEKEIPGIEAFVLPDKRLSEINAEIADISRQMEAIDAKLHSFADYRTELDAEMANAESKIEFEAALAELVRVDDVPRELAVSWLKGYALADDADKLKALALEKGWAFLACDPDPDDVTPVKLKNSKFVQLIRPVIDFLELVPGYNEKDISGLFMFFLCVFFGIIFGDAGYGFLLLLISIFGIIKAGKKKAPAILKLLSIFSISNIIWGTLSCTWLGIPIDRLPQFFRDISLSYISPAKTEQVFVDQNLQIFCFSLALVHLSFAHINNFIIAVRKKSLKIFAELGSIIMLIGIFNLILFFVVSNKYRSFEILPVMPYLIVSGLVLNLVFSCWEGNFVKSILGGLSNIMSIILSVVNMFSDIMSYIRLWAVGMAGAAIAAIVTSMASPMLGNFLIFLGIIVLAFGHGLNIILSVLSVLIHGIRLNILEFSSHSGVTWSGVAYKPFANRKI